MKRFSIAALIVLSVGLAMTVVGSVLVGVTFTGNFDATPLAATLREIGYITAALSGIVLVALGVSHAIRTGVEGK